MVKNVSLSIATEEDSSAQQTIVEKPVSERPQAKKAKLKIDVGTPNVEANGAQGGSKKLTADEKRAQREAANQAKAEKKAEAARKKAEKEAAEAEGDQQPSQPKKAEKAQEKLAKK